MNDSRAVHEEGNDVRGEHQKNYRQNEVDTNNHPQVKPDYFVKPPFVPGPVGVTDEWLGTKGKANHNHNDN